jgi:hypothetical protein
MTEDLPNLPLLIKLMKLTSSPNDSEALSAVRKANEQLAKFGGDWERLLLGKVTVIADPFVGVPPPPPPEAPRRPPPNFTPPQQRPPQWAPYIPQPSPKQPAPKRKRRHSNRNIPLEDLA